MSQSYLKNDIKLIYWWDDQNVINQYLIEEEEIIC